jgi:hypothetical protein
MILTFFFWIKKSPFFPIPALLILVLKPYASASPSIPSSQALDPPFPSAHSGKDSPIHDGLVFATEC